jgi:YidC/Oxa1 family membrane protein insertase
VIDLLGSVLSTFYGLTHSYGLAIIMLTVVVRLVLFPLTLKQTRSMQGMARLQPEVKKLQAEYGSDKQKLNAEMMELYRREKINPAAGCLPLLLQIPIFFGLYQVIRGLTNTGSLGWLQVQVPSPRHLAQGSEMYKAIIEDGGELRSLGINLAETASSVTGGLGSRLPYLLMVVGIAATGFAQQIRANQLNPATTAQAAQMQNIMKILPVFFALFCFQAQAGLVLYWLASNIWTLAQQEVLHKTNPKPMVTDGGPATTSVRKTKTIAATVVDDVPTSPASSTAAPKKPSSPKRPTTPPAAGIRSGSRGGVGPKTAKPNSGAPKPSSNKKKGR